MNSDLDIIELGSLWEERNKNIISKSINKDTLYLYLIGALTDKIIKELIDIRHSVKELTIIVKDATHIVADYKYYLKLAKMNVKVNVLNEIDLLFITYNPTSPYGYTFDNEQFKKLLNDRIKVDCINVVKDLE